MRALVDLLVPPSCDGCGERARPPWCRTCAAVARRQRPTGPCPRCAGAAGPGHPCWDPSVPIAATTAISTWAGPVARTVLHAKLAGRREVLTALGARLGALVVEEVGARPDVVVPVPSDPRRVRQRGLDHAHALAAGVATACGVPVLRALRTGVRVPDRGAAAHRHRLAPLPPDAFVPARRAGEVAGRAVLLVDDVVTTGATLAAAARVLAVRGVAGCSAAVVARAGAHALGPG